MRKKMFVLVCVFLVASLLAACSPTKAQVSVMIDEALAEIPEQQAPIVNVTVPEQPAPVVNVEVPEQPAPIINVEVPEQPAPIINVAMPEAKSEEPMAQESVADLVILPDCPLKDQGVRIEFIGTLEKEDGFYNLSSDMPQLAEYAGCNFLVEGRVELIEKHNIWLFYGPFKLSIREGSLWIYPSGWNMDNFGIEKAPIATEFVVAKRHNQVANGYDWPIYVHTLSGDIVMFPAGATMPVVQLPNNADFSEPQKISVHGIWNSESEAFNASIGAEGTTTVALLDGRLFFWVNAQDNVVFSAVEAWLMPSTWDQSQVENWAEAQFPGQSLTAYAP